MKIKPFNTGIEGVSNWRRADETHLPTEGQLATEFSAELPLLDEILRPPTLDERLPLLTRPDVLDVALLEPAVMAAARQELMELLRQNRAQAEPGKGPLFEAAIFTLASDFELDAQVRVALAALFRA